jgi:hypothetical protein
MATVEKNVLWGERRLVLSGISWQLYERLRDNAENRHIRMAYDEGMLELMSPSPDHEAIRILIGKMIAAFTEELGVPLRSLGSTTWRSKDLGKDLRRMSVITSSVILAFAGGGTSISRSIHRQTGPSKLKSAAAWCGDCGFMRPWAYAKSGDGAKAG